MEQLSKSTFLLTRPSLGFLILISKAFDHICSLNYTLPVRFSRILQPLTFTITEAILCRISTIASSANLDISSPLITNDQSRNEKMQNPKR